MGLGATPKSPGVDARLTARFGLALASCKQSAAAYGACCSRMLPSVERGACEAEFAALRTCFASALKASAKSK